MLSQNKAQETPTNPELHCHINYAIFLLLHSRLISAVPSSLEAVAAVYRTIILRLKWNLGLLATLSAYYGEHLALFPVSTLTIATLLIAAITAANRLVLKAFFCIKFLLACAEDEFLTAVLTY